MLSAMTLPLLRRPSAWLPIALAAGALTLPFLALAVFGPDPTGDEGAAAHTWQLLTALQIPAIVFFLAKWLPKEPKQALMVFGLQALAFLIPFVPVWIIEHAHR